jgi:cyclophilin family peptidyl-prolyl cis-trans isomerase/HEAT repeat protein
VAGMREFRLFSKFAGCCRNPLWAAPLILIGLAVGWFSCGRLEQQYVRMDKLYKIALIEDSRAYDTILQNDELFADPDPGIRARAALAVGRIGGDYYTPTLKRHLTDTSAVAAEAKYFAAGLLADSTLFDPLLELASGRGPARDAAVEAMGRVANANQAPRLGVFLDDPDTLVVYQTLLALWRAGGWCHAATMARLGLESPCRMVQYGAVFALARGGRPEGIPLFRRFIADADPEFRIPAYAGLGRVGDTTLADIIAQGLADPDDRVVATALNALRNYGSRGAASVIRHLPRMTDEKLVSLAVEIIGENRSVAGARELLTSIFRSNNRENVLGATAKSLLQVDGAGGLPVIDERLPSPTGYQRMKIAEGLAFVEREAAVGRLVTLLADAVPVVRATALESICAVDSASAERYLTTALGDSDQMVMATAIDEAKRRGVTRLIPTIARLFLERRQGLDGDVKRTIIDAWSVFPADSAYDSLVVASLEEACNDEWLVVRREAAELLWRKYRIERRTQIGAGGSMIEKWNFRDLFFGYRSNPTATIETPRGSITIELLYDEAPMTVNNFIALAQKGFYDRRIFHRVVPAFVAQDGCPRGDGWGGPGYAIRCEYTRRSYATGAVGMALSGKDTGGSQFFITLSPQPHLDARYTVFGRVVSGMDAAQQIVRGDSITTITIQDGRE